MEISKALKIERDAFNRLNADNQQRITIENSITEYHYNITIDISRGKIISNFDLIDEFIDLAIDVSYYYFKNNKKDMMERWAKIGDYFRYIKKRWPDGILPKRIQPKSPLGIKILDLSINGNSNPNYR